MKRGIVTGLVLLASCLILILRPQKFSLLLSAYSSVLLAERGLSQCTSGLLLGGWQDSNFVPFPFNVLDVFLEEARGGLSEQKRAGLQFKGLNFGSILEAFPPLKDELAQGDGTLGFQPPCFYHFYSGDDIRRIFEGKWLYFLGDSNTRALVMGLLTLLDPTHQQPYDDKLWFNGTGGDEFPHLQYIEYFFRVDGSILAKSASGIRPPDDLPQEPYSIRISYRFKMVSHLHFAPKVMSGFRGTDLFTTNKNTIPK